MAPKPTHVKRVAELLQDGDFETPEDMAKAVINLVDELRKNDKTYMLVSQLGDCIYLGVGPFATHNQAVKAMERGHVPIADFGKHAIVPTRTPEHVLDAMGQLDVAPVAQIKTVKR